MLITVEWTGKHGSEPQNNRIAYACATIIKWGCQTFHQVGYQPPLKTPLDSQGVLFEVEKMMVLYIVIFTKSSTLYIILSFEFSTNSPRTDIFF